MTHKFIIELTDECKGYEEEVERLERIYGIEPIEERQIYLEGFRKGVLEETKERLAVMKEFENEVRSELYDEIISALEKEISYLYKGDINCGISVAIDKVKLMKEQNNE